MHLASVRQIEKSLKDVRKIINWSKEKGKRERSLQEKFKLKFKKFKNLNF